MASSISAGTTSSTALVATADTTGALQLATNNGTVAVTVDTSQNVGIGTTTPSSFGKLAVVGDGYCSGALGIGAVSTRNLETIKSDANTTYGAAAAQFPLNIRNTDTTANNWTAIGFNQGASSLSNPVSIGAQFASSTTGSFVVATSGAERMRVDSGGNLLVGSTTLTNNAKVRVYKTGNRPTIEAEQGDSGGYNFQSIAFNNGGTYYHCNFQEGGTQRGSISSNGSNTAYNTGSDYRLKDDVAPMTGALNKISGLNPVTWKWKSNGSDGQGFIAHELAEVCPDAVTGEKDAVDGNGNPVYQMVDVSYLVATLTAAIQELTAKVTSLEAKVGASA